MIFTKMLFQTRHSTVSTGRFETVLLRRLVSKKWFSFKIIFRENIFGQIVLLFKRKLSLELII